MDHNVHSISPHPIDVVPSPATVSPTVRLRSTTSRADRGIAKAYPHALPTPPPTASAVFAYPSSRATPNSMRVNAHPPSSVVPAGHFIGRGVFQAVPPKKLRPYQAEAVAQFWRDYAEGLTRLGFYLPLEDEKSVIYCTIVAEVLAATRKPNRLYSKALILVETEDLVTSCMAEFVKISGLSVGRECGGIRAQRSCRVIFATSHTLRQVGRMVEFFGPGRFSVNDFELVVVDNAHYSVAEELLGVLSHFNHGVEIRDERGRLHRSSHRRKIPILGFTARFSRYGGDTMGSAFPITTYDLDCVTLAADRFSDPPT